MFLTFSTLYDRIILTFYSQEGVQKMYQCYLGIITVSSSRRLAEIIRTAALPEDCSAAVIEQTELTEEIDSRDSAVVFDGIDALKKNAAHLGAHTRTVVVIRPGSAAVTDDITDRADDIWVIPSEGADGLVKFYAEKLISDMKTAYDYRLQTICMTTAFDSIPDLVWFKDVRGTHLMVNNGFCKAVDKTKEQIYKQGHYYIWDIPEEEYVKGDYVCLESEDIVIRARQTRVFDEKVKTKSGMRQFITYKSPLIDADGRIFGTCGVANDVTMQHNLNSELEVILDSMPFAILIENENGNVIAKNTRFDEFFPEYYTIVGKNSAEWKEKALKGNPNDNEVSVKVGGEEYFLISTERPIFSIFHEKIGSAIILTDVTKQTKSREQNILSANTDFLTGLYNRRMLFAHLELHKCSPHMAMITLDLDNFKTVNDTYGHHAGDRALIDTARLLRDCFKGDFIARLGGDEFLVVITRECSEEQVLNETRHFLEALKNHFDNKEEFSVMTASAGIAAYTITDEKGENEHNFENLMKCSDSALYDAKHSGKNMCCVYKWEW